ncbi:MAG: translation initiation factor IF-2 [Ruminiclostridium sp.]|nr:translation initiation factor IF-2 [Ruminiclostridium sp.]
MSKRVFELAKELNTTSKRLIEKLEEINISVKSHMSLLEEDELNRLYKHIGIVNRDRVEGSDDGVNVDQQEQVEVQIRKSIPRIIRKTEIIIHDDDYEREIRDRNKNKGSSNKKGYVRTSSSTDGLMAGLARGNDSHGSNTRKHNPENAKTNERDHISVKKKANEPKITPEPVDDSGGLNRGDRIRRPMDNILSIKKVSTREEREKQSLEENEIKQDALETKQNEEINKVDNKAEVDKTDSRIQKETVSAGAEKSEDHMAINTQVIQQANTDMTAESKASGTVVNEGLAKAIDQQEPSGDKSAVVSEKAQPQPRTSTKESREEGRQESREARAEDSDRNRSRGGAPENRAQSPGGDRERGPRTNQQSGYQDRDAQNRTGRYDNREGSRDGSQNRSFNREQGGYNRDSGQNRSFNRDGGQGGQSRDAGQSRSYNRDGGQNRPFNREGGQAGGFNRDGGQNRPFNRDGGQTGGYNRDGGQNRPFNRDGGQTGGYNRDGGQNRPFNRDNQGSRGPGTGGDYRPYNRDGGFTPRDKDDQGRSYGNRDQGFRGRSDDRRGPGAGGSGGRPLVIPKANVAPGQVEEKNNLRGERRSATTRDVEKTFKREVKKDVNKATVPAGPVKSKDKYKKSFAVGHTASVSDMFSDDFVLNEFYEEKEKLKKDRNKRREEKHIPPKAVLQEITIPDVITVKNLSEALKKTSAEVIKKLISLGIMATLNEELDFDTAAIVGEEFHVKVLKEVVVSDEDILFDDMDDKEEDLVERAPVVVVMGHVDHGKTSLLDAIRQTNVVDDEAGGITQRIGAYKVNIHGRDIAFLDTPGHEAFTAMRARGAQATDIAILVVAADDGVMPQTVEAINHAKAANVSLIVAINKIDKPGANPDRVKQELADRGVLIEEWGGDVIAVPVSAKKRINIEQLLEMVLLTADVLELKANPHKQAKGIIIEARLDKSLGPVATVLVQRGTLNSGDSIISGTTFGRIRAMSDENGNKIEQAGPSTPAEIFGLDEVPVAGDVFYAVSDEKVAKHLIEHRKSQQREQSIGTAPKVSLDDLFSQIQQGEVKELNLIVKADVQGSVEAVKQSVEKLSNDEVKVQVIHGGVGAINEADVTLASVSNAIIIGFNVRPPANVTEAAQNEGVDIRLYRIIYNAIEDIEKAMKGMLAPTFKEVVDGHIEIRQTFKASSVGTIGGGYVTDGKVLRNSEVRVVRNGIVVYEGKLASLKRFKDDVREVAAGYECGILIDKFNDIKEGDVIESFRMEEVQRT